MKVLIAEDDPVIALGLAERVRSLGHEPIGPAPDGRRAVELARESDPDVYLFDVGLPGIDGLDAAALLADDGRSRPVVIVTGSEDPATIARSVAGGAGAYLTKPVDTRELAAALELAAARHVELQAARQALADRKAIERAKGLLMTALGLDEQEAFRRLQRTARERNLKLADVAQRVVEQSHLLSP
jgi:response regulator NasT